MAAYNNEVVINGLIYFDLGDVELEKLLHGLHALKAPLRMDCTQCGTTIVPQCRAHYSNTGESEFKIGCVQCGKIHTVRMFEKWGFILPTDDEFYKKEKRDTLLM